MGNTFFTSESVTEGHPDKVCDQISDAVLDAYLAEDRNARVAIETLASGRTVYVVGEVGSAKHPNVDIESVVRGVLRDIGYTSWDRCFHADEVEVVVRVNAQSPEIAAAVAEAYEVRNGSDESADRYDLIGAGDQGLMFGYATSETESGMPVPILMAHRLAARLTEVRKNGTLRYLGPDGKTQVTAIQDENDITVGINTIVVSTQHLPEVSQDLIGEDIEEHVVKPVVTEMSEELYGNPWTLVPARVLVNPSGAFSFGGPAADAGLTGRKIIVDTYGGTAPHGGGAFSGKDPSKVDRSAAYAARWVAKHIVESDLARRCLVQVAYAIGASHPVSVTVKTFGTGLVEDDILGIIAADVFDLRPAAIVDSLKLRSPEHVKYRDTAAYGHFGNPAVSSPFTWEQTDPRLIAALQASPWVESALAG